MFVRVVGPEKETVLRLGDEFRCDARNGLYAELRVLFGADCIAYPPTPNRREHGIQPC